MYTHNVHVSGSSGFDTQVFSVYFQTTSVVPALKNYSNQSFLLSYNRFLTISGSRWRFRFRSVTAITQRARAPVRSGVTVCAGCSDLPKQTALFVNGSLIINGTAAAIFLPFFKRLSVCWCRANAGVYPRYVAVLNHRERTWPLAIWHQAYLITRG